MNKDIKDRILNLCNQFIKDEIGKNEIQSFATSQIVEIEALTNDELVIDTINSWEDEEMHFPITKRNIELWKLRLQTGEDQLEKYNIWNVHIEPQKAICTKYKSNWVPVNKKWAIGINLKSQTNPINGLRHPKSRGNEGWYIWSGEYNEDANFFIPTCIEHLLQTNPEIIKYLGLEEGFRFQIDDKDYEDVWYDEELVKTKYR